MVTKEMKVIIVGVLMAMFLVVANGTYLFYQVEDFTSVVSGNSVKEIVGGFYETSSMNHRVVILFQFLLLIVVIIVVFMIVKKLRSKTNLSKSDFVKNTNMKSRTDLDVLHEMLKREKQITIDNVEKVFKIDFEVALEWFKILEDGDLAIIDYPRFGKPILKLMEKNDEKESLSDKHINKQDEIPKKEIKNKVQLESQENVVPIKKDGNKKHMKKEIKIKKQVKKKIKKTFRKEEKKMLKSSKKLKKGFKLKKR